MIFSQLQGKGLRRELSAVFALALPVVSVQLGLMLMAIVSTMMLGRVSAGALAGSALGNAFTLSLQMGGAGVLLALDPLMAQAWGARDEEAVSAHFERGLVLAVVLSLPLMAILWNPRGILLHLGQTAELAAQAAAYCRGIVPGVVAFMLFFVLRQTLQAMSLVRPVVIAMVIGNLVNLLANYALIFGHFGAPALGVSGAGYATSIGRWTLVAALAVLSRPILAPYFHGLTRRAFELPAHLRQLKLGVPIGIHYSLELWVFTAVALLMGQLGIHELAGHEIALSLAALSYMVPAGVGAAAASRVGNAIGRADMPGARLAATASLFLGVGFMSLSALLFGLAPRLLAGLYSADPGVVAMGASLLPIAAVFQIFDGTQVVASGVLRGAADTRFSALVAFIGYWGLGLPLGALLAFRTAQGPRGLWWGLTLGLASVAILLVGRILRRFSGAIARAEGVLPLLET